MIISLCSSLFDYSGNYLLEAENDTDLSHVARRVSRTATLDGGCVIVDNGYTASDATFSIVIRNIDATTRLGLLGLIQRHSALVFATPENVFLGVVEKVDDTDKMKIRFLVQRQLNG